MQEVTFPVRVMFRLGVKLLFVSNAAGAVNPEYRVGDLMVISDHINLLPNPLIGPNMEEFGPRFPDMTTVYSKRIRQLAVEEAEKMGERLRMGVYVAGTGPTYETPAEYKFYKAIGGDAAGMSTIPEVIVARHCGMEIFGMSVITNQSNDLSDTCLNSGEDVVKQANLAAEKMTTLFERVITRL
jgi:purine-nucleoside phosphorylase